MWVSQIDNDSYIESQSLGRELSAELYAINISYNGFVIRTTILYLYLLIVSGNVSN